MEVHIKAFGRIADITAKDNWSMAGVSSTSEVRQALETQFPELRGMSYQIAVNKQIAPANSPVPAGAEVALLPPFSGG